MARRVASLCLAFHLRCSWRYIRTHRNHADGPSRGYPLGVAPKEEAGETGGIGGDQWIELPDVFYRLTRG
eukprot:3167516-Alexandrium_andersonii.AAC.1